MALKDDGSLKKLDNWQKLLEDGGELVGGVLYVDHKEVGRLQDGVMYDTAPKHVDDVDQGTRIDAAPRVESILENGDPGSQLARTDGVLTDLAPPPPPEVEAVKEDVDPEPAHKGKHAR
jgi:hypothetical protein